MQSQYRIRLTLIAVNHNTDKSEPLRQAISQPVTSEIDQMRYIYHKCILVPICFAFLIADKIFVKY